ncbi:MAG: SpoIID/LytB domain-containing protein, partial [Planctomycetota bacterium]
APVDVRGELTLLRGVDARIALVVTIGMEDWVRGSVLAEMPAKFGAEALRAQAVAIRTYGLHKLLTAGQASAPFDLESSVADLRYGGVAYEGPEGNDATDQTRGQAMTWQGRLFTAYFHSTSGGATISAEEYFGKWPGFRPLSGVASPESSESPMNEWEIVHSWRDVRSKLIAAGLGLSADVLGEHVQSVARIYRPGIDRIPHPLTADPARRPQAYRFETDRGTVDIAAKTLRMTIGAGRTGMPSTCCVIVPEGDNLRLIGRGWGHGVGMCQFGAAGMAKGGATWRQILERYYPGARIVQWYRD